MRTGLYGAAATVALLGIAAPAGAVTMTLDDFTDPQLVVDAPGTGQTNASERAIGSDFAGVDSRDLEADNFDDQQGGTELRVLETEVEGETEGVISFSNISLEQGEGLVTYDGEDGDPTSLDRDGLGGVDLVLGPQPFFNFDIVSSDAQLMFTADAYDTSGGVSTFEQTLPETEDLSPILPFGDFTAVEGGGADFTDIGALQFSIQSSSDANDGTLAAIEVSAIPAPASALLLMGGLGGLPLLRSFRRKS